MKLKFLSPRMAALIVGSLMAASSAMAVTVNWTDWTTGNPGAGTAQGTITTDTSTVTVNYSNPQGYGFMQTSSGTDYWIPSAPYVSSFVDNAPVGPDIVGLTQAGMQTLTFSETIANPFFAFVSLNGNGYGFDQDFEILSYGNGYWGGGSVAKNVVDLGGGNFEYQLIGSGEPHGTIRFLGAFDSVSWKSLTSENWNGFTVGIEGTAEEVFGVPDAGSTLPLLGGVFGVLAMIRRRIR
jgi:hypothetical protein